MTEYNWLCPVCPAHGYESKKNSKAKSRLKAHKNGIRHIRRVHNFDGEPIVVEIK